MRGLIASLGLFAVLSFFVYGASLGLPAPVADDSAGAIVSPVLYPSASFEISRDQQNSVVFVKVQPSTDSRARMLASPDPISEGASFLDSNKALFGISDVSSELRYPRAEKDSLGMTHVTYYQYYNGIPVFGGGVQVHLGADGRVSSVTPRFAGSLSLNTAPAITPGQAESFALAGWQGGYPAGLAPNVEVSPPVVFPKSLVDNDGNGKAYLAYPVRIYFGSGDEVVIDDTYYVDALNGDIIQKISNNREYGSCPTANATIFPCRRVYDCDTFPGNSSCGIDYNTTQYPTYYFGRSEGRPPRGPDPRPNPPSMFGGSINTDQMFDMFLALHNYWNYTYGRFGANARGGSSWGANENYTRAFTHLDMAPIGLINCLGGHAWFAGSNQAIHVCLNMVIPEILGHEYAHAVLFYEFYNSSGWPVGPTYYGETGALDESHADLQGTFFERDSNGGSHDWVIGGKAPMNWTRNLANPEQNQVAGSIMNYSGNLTAAYYPNHYYDSNFYCGSGDSGGVHVDSTVPSKAAYLMMAGGSFNGCEIQGMGEPAFQQIIYRAWTAYASSTESFNAFAVHMNASCRDLYGSTHPEYCSSLVKAYQAVEMDQAGACSNRTEAPPACAVKNLATVYARTANGLLSSSFLPTNAIWVGGDNGTPGKTVTIYLMRRNGTLANWAKLYSLVNTSTTILANGSINASLGAVNLTGTYDLIADANNDGYYHQWADAASIVYVAVPYQECTPVPETACKKIGGRYECTQAVRCK